MAVNGVSVVLWDGKETTAQDFRMGLAALLGNGSGRALGGVNGSRPGSTPCTVAGSTVTIPARTVSIDPVASNAQAPYLVSWRSAMSVTLDPAPSSNSRVDAVYVRLFDTVFDGSGQQTVVFDVAKGTAGATPQRPTQTADGTSLSKVCVLAWVTVPSSGAATVLPGPELAAAGGIRRLNDAAEETAYGTEDGAFAYRRDRDVLRVNHGSGWRDYDPPRVRATATVFSNVIPAGTSGPNEYQASLVAIPTATPSGRFALDSNNIVVTGRGLYLIEGLVNWTTGTTARSHFRARRLSDGGEIGRANISLDDTGAPIGTFTIDAEAGTETIRFEAYHSETTTRDLRGSITITRIGG